MRAQAQLRGTLAAALTPLGAGGEKLDEAGIAAVVGFLRAAGLDGLLAFGTTGEGMLLDPGERRRGLELFVAAAGPGFPIVAQCGAQTTAQTVDLAAHAAAAGAAAVAVISPPYFALSEEEIEAHLLAAGQACAPLDYYVYEFEDRSGYRVPPPLLDRLRSRLPNLRGLKVSDAPWERFEPYLLDGIDVFVGPEALISQGLARGAVGAVSALASALPELVLHAVRSRAPEASAACAEVRREIARFPFHSALKSCLAGRGVAIRPEVRRPLQTLSGAEQEAFAAVAARAVAAAESCSSSGRAGPGSSAA